MRQLVRKLLFGALCGASLLALSPAPVKADADDRYWRRHWGWYDNTYRPYYYRRNYNNYYAPPAYSYPYNSPYIAPPNYYGGNTTYYYGGPAYPYSGGGVSVGPLRFGWW